MNLENRRTVYQTDGSKEGFLTAVFEAYNDTTAFVTSSTFFQQSFYDEVVRVQTDVEKARRVKKKLFECSRRGGGEVFAILRSEE